MAGKLILSPLIRRDAEDGGSHRIRGTVTEDGAVANRRVRLFNRVDGRLMRETWSAADGSYQFNRIAYRDQGYTVIVYDHGANPKNAAIADLVTPEPMP